MRGDASTTPATMHYRPGTLNVLDTPEWAIAISPNDSGKSVQYLINQHVLTPNKFESVGTLYGILLRENSPYSDNDPYTPLDILHAATFAMRGADGLRLPTYKVRIPELHFMLPIPKNLNNPTQTDKIIIDCYPTIQAVDTKVSRAQPGDIVKIEMANRGTISRLYYLGPVDPDSTANPWVVGPHSPPYNYGQLLEECKKKYSNAGSRGDVIGRGDNVAKPNSDVPIVVKGLGHGENKIIIGTVYKKWLHKLFQRLKAEDKYKGLVWLGVCKNNGAEDQEKMLTGNGATIGRGTGRSTIIYMPASTDPHSPLEIIYWFHDALGFKNNTKEWNKLWVSLKAMSKKKSTLDGARRNFILVIPEMLWSEEASGIYSSREGELIFGASAMPTTNGAFSGGYKNREWAAWGFDGIPNEKNIVWETFGDKSISFAPISYSEAGAPVYTGADLLKIPAGHSSLSMVGNPRLGIPFGFQPLSSQVAPIPFGDTITWQWVQGLPSNVAGDMVLLHQEILAILKDRFGVATDTNKYVTLVGHKKGGIAIANLARLNKLGKGPAQLYASKISFIDGDYAGMNYVSPKKLYDYGKNWYHGGDLYEVIRNIDDSTTLEIHLSWGAGTPLRPKQTAGAFLGALQHVRTWALALPGFNFDKGVEALDKFYSYIWPKYWPNDWSMTGPAYTSIVTYPVWSSAKFLKKTYTEGYGAIQGKINEMIQLPSPFSNIIFKGWPTSDAQGALAWLPHNAPMSVATVKETTQDKFYKKFNIDPDIPSNIKNIFKDFRGNLILYRSQNVGPSKTVAILEPYGTAAQAPYELIYYFHGDIGLNGAAKTFQSALKNQFNVMIGNKRNVIIVLMDIDPYPMSPSSNLWDLDHDPSASSFGDFHQEVLNKISSIWSADWLDTFGHFVYPESDAQELGPVEQQHYSENVLPSFEMATYPSFITFKAHGGAGRMLKHIIDHMNNNDITSTWQTTTKWKYDPLTGVPLPDPTTYSITTPLRRIDFWDANWGPEYGIFNKIYYTWPAATLGPAQMKINPGTNFEIQMVATPRTFPPHKVTAIQRAKKYMAGEKDAKPGLWVEQTIAAHGTLPFKFFSKPSKLDKYVPPTPPAGALENKEYGGSPPGEGAKNVPPVPLKFDNKGKAYTLDGEKMPAYDLKKAAAFIKGLLKNHIPSTEQIGGTMGCEVGSRKTYGITKIPSMSPVGGEMYKCKTNPLGLVEYETSQFASINISPTRSGYSWGSSELDSYLKGIDNIFWTTTSPPTTWVVKDISPQGVNGIDKVRGHDSHREGIDVDILLPQLNIDTSPPTPTGKPNEKKKVVTVKEFNVDKALIFIMLSKFYGAKVIFLDKKFFKRIRDRAIFIATDGTPTGSSDKFLKVDKAYKSFLKENLFGKLDFVNQLMRLLKHKKHHENHFHVRIGREWGSHETSDYPKWALQRLKSLGCDYKNSSII